MSNLLPANRKLVLYYREFCYGGVPTQVLVEYITAK